MKVKVFEASHLAILLKKDDPSEIKPDHVEKVNKPLMLPSYLKTKIVHKLVKVWIANKNHTIVYDTYIK